ncbi:MAG: cyclic nucleotide-binding domain-containing protein [Gammaproteobacteria bacterium]|nr:cyclic nucleotide-binding domain-containing protein [Gammaproteobacteria bacterium]
MSTRVEVDQLKLLIPINSLSPDNLREIAGKTDVQSIVAGRYIFKKGDTDKKHVYLLSGKVELLDEKQQIKIIEGGKESAQFPLAHNQPRKLSARAVTACNFISLDSNLLDIMMTWNQTGTYHVEVLDEDDDSSSNDDDWMTQLLHTKAFHKVPPANIQAIFLRVQQVEYKAGDVVIKQGEEGEYFYIIKTGRALVTRATPSNPKGIKLAELGPGDSFGEESLISESKRNASITMLCKSTLARLSKNDFISLLNEPLQSHIGFADAFTKVESGEAEWLDVRLPSEFSQSHIKGSTNSPLISMRLKIKTLDKNKKYILCCDTGRRSSAAAYVLSEHGLECIVLENGIQSVPDEHIQNS